MREKNTIIICITVLLCVSIICTTVIIINNHKSSNNPVNTTNTTLVNKTNQTNNNTIVESKINTKSNNEANVVGDVVHNGPKNYSHYKCGGHIVYNGEEGRCSKCGASFYKDYVVD